MQDKSFDRGGKSRASNEHGPDKAGLIFEEVFQEFIVVSAMGLWKLLKLLFSRWFLLWWGVLFGLAYLLYPVARYGDHIMWMYSLEPRYITTEKNLEWLWRIPYVYHWGLLYCLALSPLLLVLGGYIRSIRVKYQRLFQSIGLTNGSGDTPKLINSKKHDKYRKSYTFDANGVGLAEFEDKKERLEASLGINVESIKRGSSPKHVIVTLTKLQMPNSVNFTQLIQSYPLHRDHFFLGVSNQGPVVQDVTELPHMLIAGATGSGKSVFFKQALMGLLESTNHLQMYCIDLKGGLELIDFANSPNVKVVKSIDDAVMLLRRVNQEMKDRFAYLESKGRKKIVPDRDSKDRIVIAVDESSVLYMNRPRTDPDYHASIEARTLADSIAKLARAAGIHLLLATQKLDKQVIPTSVTENISGRMAFRANSLQGSMVVLGTKDAMELPEIPGRGIWSFGTKTMIIQAPFIDETSIRSRCEKIQREFKSKRRTCLSPMIGESQVKSTNDAQEDVFGEFEGGSNEI